MKTILCCLASLGLLLASLPASAQAPKTEPTIVYKPPLRGAPSRRIGGGSRGPEQALPMLHVLAPDHVGLTISEQPNLYWYLSRPTQVRIEITVIDEVGIRPIVEERVPQAEGPAIHGFSLAQSKVRLKPGVEYQWSVALVLDAAERSNDVISGGVIKRVAPPAELAPTSAEDPVRRAANLASAGLWYDAVDVLSHAIEANPAERGLRDARAALSEQVGLKEAAAFDRGYRGR